MAIKETHQAKGLLWKKNNLFEWYSSSSGSITCKFRDLCSGLLLKSEPFKLS